MGGEGRAADLAIVEPPGDDAFGVVNFYFHSERRVEIGYVVAPEALRPGLRGPSAHPRLNVGLRIVPSRRAHRAVDQIR